MERGLERPPATCPVQVGHQGQLFPAIVRAFIAREGRGWVLKVRADSFPSLRISQMSANHNISKTALTHDGRNEGFLPALEGESLGPQCTLYNIVQSREGYKPRL